MLNPNLTLEDSAGNAHEFHLVNQQGSSTSRRNIESTRRAPFDLNIQHTDGVTKATGVATDRHLVQLKQAFINSQGKPVYVTTNLTFAVDRDEEIDDSVVYDHSRMLMKLMLGSSFDPADFTNNDFLAAVLRGES